ncbi:acyltransferase family protein [Brevundimonas sp.]|jgi:exopolysaccharide production protein ExoZ|uniref:acyltransferase family protein n=1 Tax=Brevundimonas sp. TaxID=1871086 RepID=UPI0037BFBE67
MSMLQGQAHPASRVMGIQWGRALAAIAVAVAHAISHPSASAPGASHLVGRVGVALFFVISGYIMVVTTSQGSFSPLDFMRRRLLRIVPLYYIATAVTVAGVLIAPWAFKQTTFDLKHLVLSLLFVPAHAPSGDINPVMKLGWTLNYEMFFYVLFALLSGLTALKRAIGLSLIFGVLIIAGLTMEFHSAAAIFYTRIDSLAFVAGVWLAVATQGRPVVLSRQAMLTLVTFVVGVLTVILATYDRNDTNPMIQVWIIATCVAIVGLLAFGTRPLEARMPSWATVAGDASYAIYLFHLFAVAAVTVAVRKLLPPEFLVPGMAAAAVAGVAGGLFIYWLIDRPLDRTLRRWSKRVRPAGSLGVQPITP